jgi:hypothetical protein
LPCVRQRVKQNSRLLPQSAIDLMTEWYDKNYSYPYPTYRDCEHLANAGQITINQVKQWFVNVRRRTQNQFRRTHDSAVSVKRKTSTSSSSESSLSNTDNSTNESSQYSYNESTTSDLPLMESFSSQQSSKKSKRDSFDFSESILNTNFSSLENNNKSPSYQNPSTVNSPSHSPSPYVQPAEDSNHSKMYYSNQSSPFISNNYYSYHNNLYSNSYYSNLSNYNYTSTPVNSYYYSALFNNKSQSDSPNEQSIKHNSNTTQSSSGYSIISESTNDYPSSNYQYSSSSPSDIDYNYCDFSSSSSFNSTFSSITPLSFTVNYTNTTEFSQSTESPINSF